jgi:glycosyltransferase involved in cell wall biosynthesis
MDDGTIRVDPITRCSCRGEQTVRIALINDGMYPYRFSVGGTWCHRLVRGLPEHAFHLVSVVDREPAVASYFPPTNTLSLTTVGIDGPPVGPARGRAALQHRRAATHGAVLLCRSMLEDTPHSLAMFRSSLRRLTSTSATGNHPMHGVPLAAVLTDAWRAAGPSPTGGWSLVRAALPPVSGRDAADAAELLERALRPLAAPLPMTDLGHATDASMSALVAIAAKWRTGAPFVLTEHRTYLDAQILTATAGRPAVRAVLLRFLRALARLAYLEASKIVVPNEQLRSFALDHDADREKIAVVPYGVDPHGCPTLRGEPTDPVITWLGPDRDLPTMLAALDIVREELPDARLIVAGPATGAARTTGEEVSFLGPVTHRRSAYATGQVVALSGRGEWMPYALIEAMMCGRPVVCQDSGGLASMAGLGASIVSYDDPEALAAGCLTLLHSRDRRRQQSMAAGQRARNLFGLRMMLDRYRTVYDETARDTAAPTEHLVTLYRDAAAELAS